MFCLLHLHKRGYVVLYRSEPNKRPKASLTLLQDVRMFEMMLQLSRSLDPGVAHLTDFEWVELVPFAEVEILVEVSDEFSMNKIDKGIPDITIVLIYGIVTL